MNNSNYLIITITNDLKEIFETKYDDNKKFIIAIRCINTIFLILDNLFIDKEFKNQYYKKMLVIYNFIINIKNIKEYDIYLLDIYEKIKKKYSKLAENLHLKKTSNYEYHLNMIYFYNNSNDNLNNLYNYYLDNKQYKKCLKLLNKNSNDYFINKVILLKYSCQFDLYESYYPSCIDYIKHQSIDPAILSYLNVSNDIIQNNNKLYFKNILDQAGNILLKTNYIYTHNIVYFFDDVNDIYNELFFKNFFIHHAMFNVYVYVFSKKTNYNKHISEHIIYRNFDLDSTAINTIIKQLNIDKISILINLCKINNTKIYTLLSYKIITIQINYYTYIGPVNNFIDYILCDKYIINKKIKNELFNENILYLPQSLIIITKLNNVKLNKTYDHIISKIIGNNNIDLIYDFLFNYYNKELEQYIDNINLIYNRELLINRKIKLIFEKINEKQIINDIDLLYNKIYNLKKNKFNIIYINNIFLKIILPKIDKFKFICASNLKKITKQDIIIYIIILEKCPNSVLFFIEESYDQKEYILKIMSNLVDRIYFIPFIGRNIHIYRLLYFDVVLDTISYNLKSSIYDILLLNIPIVTLEGYTIYSRLTYSVLKTLNLDELITRSSDKYINLATKLYNNPNFLLEIKKKLKTINNNSSFKKQNYVNNLCKCYMLALENHKKHRSW